MARPTLYQQLAADLRRAIFSGQMPPGTQLPTEHELMVRHHLSRNTVRLALGLLVNEGLITRSPRRGTVVRKRRTLRIMPQAELVPDQPAADGDDQTEREARNQRDAFVRAVAAEGRRPRQIIEVSIVRPPEDVATRLALPEDGLAVARKRLRFVDDEPYNVYDSYFPLDLVQGSPIARPGDIGRGANRVLAELGHPQIRVVDEISARMPSPEEAQRLELEPGTPLVVYIRTGYDAEDLPVRVAVSMLPADKHVIRYELDRE